MRLFVVVAIFLSSLPAWALGQDIELLLPPQTIEPPVAPRLMPQGYYPPIFPAVPPQLPRPGTREQWQYLGVTDTGRWRPRVILSPYGSYYYYSGEPFGWITSRPSSYMPYALD